MAQQAPKPRRQRGSIRPRGNSFEVRVYVGKHPETGKDLYLSETCPDEREAEKALTRMLADVDAGKAAQTTDRFEAGIRRWLVSRQADVRAGNLSARTFDHYKKMAEKHVIPRLGKLPINRLNQRLAFTAEALYDELTGCQIRCGGRMDIEHHAPGRGNSRIVTDLTGHQCNSRCKQHFCKSASPAMLIKVHTVITGTCKTLYRWGWIPTNPAGRICAPQVPKAVPYAPTTPEVVQLVNAAFEQDADWGTAVWRMLVTTGRRGEVVRTQTKHINFDRSLIFVPSTKVGGTGRWVAIDEITLMLLKLQVERIAKKRAAAGLRMTGEEYLYSYDPTHETHGSLDYYTERFTKMSNALGIKATPHDVRHYGATELIANGVDVVSAARRLGHSRPSTTSDVYAAWRPEADTRSAGILAAGLKLPAQYELPRTERDYSAEQPSRTGPELEQRICDLRRRTSWGPKRIREHLAAEEVSVAESTIWKVLDRHGLTGNVIEGALSQD